ncbi:ATP-binding protein [Microtetraspora sp. NBRC 13810]|uniref:ATP-binding protein n=1 Tax=Microtetraspora sp. NBRC 13810 TaxID=3030990 RepID=UPI00255406FA|nr:ATP-binding protein [Microtetraspora sp. NBRC 13810]
MAETRTWLTRAMGDDHTGYLMSAGHSVPLTEIAALLTSELVTNSIRHSRSGEGGFVQITMIDSPSDPLARNGPTLRVAVRDDGGTTLPELRAPEDDEEGGRGLFIVDAYATRWGSGSYGGATVTWFELEYRHLPLALFGARSA